MSESARVHSLAEVGPIHLRAATASDLPAMARLHRSAYSREHFLALLPEAVLADYYSRFLGGGSLVVLAVEDAGPGSQPAAEDLLGFAVFGRNIEPRIAEFKRDRRGTIISTALRHPLLATRKMLVSVGGLRRGGPPRVAAPAVLLSIAVRTGGKGVGRTLLEDMLRRSADAGEDRIGLYVRHKNVAAINAYLRVGFRIVESTTDQYYMERELVAGS